MKKEYYYPTIEEFHVGFRFEEEFKNPNWRKMIKPPTDVWEFIKLRFDTSHSISRITKKIRLSKVRVKYLDHDDIIEAGWELIDGMYSMYVLGRYYLKLENDKVRIMVRHQTDIFKGKIANYNKLLDVMDMLGINKEL
jgi:hypothetical protein